MGHAEAQRGNAHRGTGHLTWVGMGTQHGVGGWAVEMSWSGTHQECGGGAGAGRDLLEPAALGHKAGDKAGDSTAASASPLSEMRGQRQCWRGHRGVLWCRGGWWHCWGQCLRWLLAGCALGLHHKMLQASESLWRCWSTGAAQPWPPTHAVLCAAVPWWLPSQPWPRQRSPGTPGEVEKELWWYKGSAPLVTARWSRLLSVGHCQGWECSS